jgi:hypothetical protein
MYLHFPRFEFAFYCHSRAGGNPASQSGFPPCHLYMSLESCPESGMKLSHRHSTGTGLLFQQEAKTSGRIADQLARIAEEFVELIIQETTELEFSKHLTVTSGRRPSRSASPGSSEAAARESTLNRSLKGQRPDRSHCQRFPYDHCMRSFMNGIHSTTA